jgi:hypothetical protein
MPIEIREINIKATISEGKKPTANERPGKSAVTDKETIVAECVERVMELLKLKQER